ncbi:hypothetical protein [Streptococcus salivarius]
MEKLIDFLFSILPFLFTILLASLYATFVTWIIQLLCYKILKISTKRMSFKELFYIYVVATLTMVIFGFFDIRVWTLITVLTTAFITILDKKVIETIFPVAKIDNYKVTVFKLLYLSFIPFMYLSFYITTPSSNNSKQLTYVNNISIISNTGDSVSTESIPNLVLPKEKTKDSNDFDYKIGVFVRGVERFIIAFSLYGFFLFIIGITKKYKVLSFLGIDNLTNLKGRWDYIDDEKNVVKDASIFINNRFLFDNFHYVDTNDLTINKTFELKTDINGKYYIECDKGLLTISYDKESQRLHLGNNEFVAYRVTKSIKDIFTKIFKSKFRKKERVYRLLKESIFYEEREFRSNKTILKESCNFFSMPDKKVIDKNSIEVKELNRVVIEGKSYLSD